MLGAVDIYDTFPVGLSEVPMIFLRSRRETGSAELVERTSWVGLIRFVTGAVPMRSSEIESIVACVVQPVYSEPAGNDDVATMSGV